METSYIRLSHLFSVVAGVVTLAVMIALPATLGFLLSASAAVAWCQWLERESRSIR